MKPSDINPLHRALERKIKDVLKFTKLGITQPRVVGDWRKAAAGSPVVFELLYDGTYQEQTAQRDMGGRCSVFALHPKDAAEAEGTQYWVSWFERWKVKVATKRLNLCTAGWSVFAGPPNQEKQQVIRAEWDQLLLTGRARSGQPHWHVDRFPQSETTAHGACAVATPPQAALVLGSDTDGAPELGALHLAMGAWNGKEDHPRCWQRSASEPEDLLTWGVRTLQYLQSELPVQP